MVTRFILALLFALATLPAFGWFSNEEYGTNTYVSYVGDEDTSPVWDDLAPDYGLTPCTLTHLDSDAQGDVAYGVYHDGTFLYLANGTGGVHTYSVDGAGNLTHLDSDDQGDKARGVYHDGTFLYLANGGGGVHTYSVDGAGNLTHLDSDNQGDNAYGVYHDGTFLYLANGGIGVHTYSVDDATFAKTSLSAALRTKLTKSATFSIPITQALVQWAPGSTGGVWSTLQTITGTDITLTGEEFRWGYGVVTQFMVGVDTDFRLRVWFTGGGYENADVADDTTGDGTNNWHDQWVVLCHSHATNKRPPRMSFGF